MPVSPAGESEDRVGSRYGKQEYGFLTRSMNTNVLQEMSIGRGLFTSRRHVGLGGSWTPLDGSGNVVETSFQSGSLPDELYAVFFRMTADHEGELVDFELAAVVDPRTESNEIVQVEIPKRYIELARIRAAARSYEPSANDDELIEFFDYFFYCPDYPTFVIPRPDSG